MPNNVLHALRLIRVSSIVYLLVSVAMCETTDIPNALR